jgi:hypothetical protein
MGKGKTIKCPVCGGDRIEKTGHVDYSRRRSATDAAMRPLKADAMCCQDCHHLLLFAPDSPLLADDT